MTVGLGLAIFGSMGVVLAQDPKPVVDRSGEPALKKLMESLSKQKAAHYYINTFSRESETGMYFEGNQFDLIFGESKKFRMVVSNMWGDGRVYVSDGKTMLIDHLDIAQGVVLKDVGKTLLESDSEIDAKGSYGLVATILFQGEEVIEKIAAKESAISFAKLDGISTISVKKSTFGNLKIVFRESKSGPILIRCEYDNWDYKLSQNEKYPDWVSAPEIGTLDVEVFRSTSNRKIPKNAFDPTPSKGLNVADERKKDKKPVDPRSS